MVKYKINNFKGIQNFNKMNWNTQLLNKVYNQRMNTYLPKYRGELERSEMKYADNNSLNIKYTAGHASTAYEGIYFGERRNPKRTYHRKATKAWVKVFTDNNQELIKRAFDMWIRRVIK